MKIYIDVGNTSTSVYFSEEEQIEKIDIKTYKNIKIVGELERLIYKKDIASAFLTSVVPEVNYYIIQLLKIKKINVLKFKSDYYNLICDYSNINANKIGADRVIVDSASIDKYGKDVIVVDLGTAMTIDVIKDSTFISGYIYPGLATSLNALISNASQLKEIEFNDLNHNSTCLSTSEQINDGLILGMLGALSKLIEHSLIHFNENVRIIITGGFFNMIVDLIGLECMENILKCHFIYDRDLIIDGMMLLEQKLGVK